MDVSRSIHLSVIRQDPLEAHPSDLTPALCQMLAAGIRLAFDQVQPGNEHRGAICLECQAFASPHAELRHNPGCSAGEILRLSAIVAGEPTDERRGAEASQSVDAVPGAGAASPPLLGLVDRVMARRGLPLAPSAFGEPWSVDSDGDVVDARQNIVVDAYGCVLVEPDDAAAMARIAACVNACAGVPTESLGRCERQLRAVAAELAEALEDALECLACDRQTLAKEFGEGPEFLAVFDEVIGAGRAALAKAAGL